MMILVRVLLTVLIVSLLAFVSFGVEFVWGLEMPSGKWVAFPPPPGGSSPTQSGKHVRVTYNPQNGWFYLLGGDHGGSGSNGGTTSQNGRQEFYRFKVEPWTWEMVHKFCRDDGLYQPRGPDESGLAYDSTRGVLWHVPGFQQSSNKCPDAQGVLSQTMLPRGKMMQFSPLSGKWVEESAFPGFNRKTISSLGQTAGNHRQFIYDAPSDAIIGLREAKAFSYSVVNDTWKTIRAAAGSGMRVAGDEYIAHDRQGRRAWVVENAIVQRLYQYNIETETFIDLGAVPASVPFKEKESHLHWDASNKLLLWPVWKAIQGTGGNPSNDNEIEAFYAYHVPTAKWETLPITKPTVCPAGTDCTVRGRHSLFDPVENVLVVWMPKGGGVIGGPAPMFVYRYGEGSTVPPADTVPPSVPENVEVQ